MDLTVFTDRYPKDEETIIGKRFLKKPGGKGANQAVSVGKLDGNVDFIGACGNDFFGDELLESLKKYNVNIENVLRLDEDSGIASIIVKNNGGNKIIVVPGANKFLTPDRVKKIDKLISESEIIMLQLEIPKSTVEYVVTKANNLNKTIIFDPAPAQKLSDELLSKIDYLLPNEHELEQLINTKNNVSYNKKIEILLNKGVNNVLLTRGSKGVSHYHDNMKQNFSALNVNTVDTTGAGDSFAGGFALGLSKGLPTSKAIELGIIVAGFSVTKSGAQESFPTINNLESFCNKQNISNNFLNEFF